MHDDDLNEARTARSRAGRRRALGLLLVLCLCAAAACSSGGDDDDDDGPAPAAPSGKADPDGAVRLAYDLAGAAKGGFTFDPSKTTTQLTDSGLFHLIYGGLFRKGGDGALVPDLAQSGEVIDPNTIELRLREGVTFADGDPFDAEAVKAGLDRNLALVDSPAFGDAFFDLESVAVVDPATVRLSIPNGTAPAWFDTFLASWETAIVPADTDFSLPSGAGPMKVTAYQAETSARLERNSTYWDAKSIKIGAIDLVHAPDVRAATQALAAGQVDMANVGDVAQIPSIGNGNEVLVEPNPNTLSSFQICKKEGPLSEAEVRLALNKAIDREAINEAVYDGTYEPSSGLWPRGHRFHDPELDDVLAYDPEAAKELLAEAGYADGFGFDLYVIAGGGMPEVAQIVQQQLAEIGVEIEIISSPNYVEDFLLAQKPGAGAVPTMTGGRLKLLNWSGKSIGNACFYQDPELEAMERELNAVSDASEESVELWHAIERKVVEEALSVFLLFGSSIVGYDPDVIGEPAIMPETIVVPDVRQSFVKAE